MAINVSSGVRLKDAHLFRQACYVDGAWVEGTGTGGIDVDNPATGEIIGTVPKLGRAETRQAIDAAARAFPAWRARTAKERATVMRRWFDLMMANQDDLANLMTVEQGKPLTESKGEVAYAASFLEWFGEEAKRVYGDTIPPHQPDKRNVITGSATDIGAELTGNPLVRKLSFTGSTATGKLLMAQCASTVKKLSLELGGNAPFIVFDDADLDAAVDGAIMSKYRNTGQTCVCANRLLIQDSVYDKFAARLADAVKKLKPAPGGEAGATQRPLIDDRAVQKVEQHISDATSKGARVLVGGKRHALGGRFFEPTI